MNVSRPTRLLLRLAACAGVLALAGCTLSDYRGTSTYRRGIYAPYPGTLRWDGWYGSYRYDPFYRGYYYDAWGRPLHYGPGYWVFPPPVYRPPRDPVHVPKPRPPREVERPIRPRGPQHHRLRQDAGRDVARPRAIPPGARPERPAAPRSESPRAVAPPRTAPPGAAAPRATPPRPGASREVPSRPVSAPARRAEPPAARSRDAIRTAPLRGGDARRR